MIILVTLIASIQHRIKKKGEKIIAFSLTVLFPTLIAAFRYNNGADYPMYYQFFLLIGKGVDVNNVPGKTLEIGFIKLVKLCQIVSTNQWFTFGIIALLITYIFLTTCLENSDNYKYSVLLFFITGVYFDTFNGLRQYLAVAIFFYSFKYIVSGDFKKYLLFIVVGSLFHKSIFFCIPLYFLRYIKFDAIKSTILIILSVVVGGTIYRLFLIVLKYTSYSYFVNSVELNEINASTSSILFTLVTGIIGYVFYSKKCLISSKTVLLFNIHVITTVISLLTIFIPLINRFLYYGMAIDLLYLPNVLSLIKKKKTKYIVALSITMMYIIITTYGIIKNGWYTCYPYRFYFFN